MSGFSRPRILILFALSVLLSVAVAHARSRKVFSSLTVHEWGTFTSVAGTDGEAVEWSPASATTDLPAFVEHLGTVHYKFGLRGTVRMETPVIYFYSPREERISVSVRFKQGFITEWYPHANRVEPEQPMWVGSVSRAPANGSITWDAVTLSPSLHAEFPESTQTEHYFAARQTTSTPISVQTPQGEQREKFLFYRGVAGFASPIRVTVHANDGLAVENRAEDPPPAVIRFERHGQKIGYRIEDGSQSALEIASPGLTGSIHDLAHELEGILVSQGLYQNEAHAMLETWRDSWFEEGSRLFYIAPRSFVDSVLPLSINPQPQQITRVFVGRIELITGTTKETITQAVDTDDSATLATYGRFLEPMLVALLRTETDDSRIAKLHRTLDALRVQMEAIRN